jgi:hypothetical protein
VTPSRRIVAFVRVLIVALSLCLLGTAHTHTQGTDAAAASDPRGPQPDHATAVDLPDPGAALTEERDEDPRDSEDGDTRPPPRATDVTPSMRGHRAMMARGPPEAPRPVAHRPRSSRGPPAQV